MSGLTRQNVEPMTEDRLSASGDPIEFAELWRPSGESTGQNGPEGILLERGAVRPEQIEQARKAQQDDPRLSVLDALVQAGAVDDIVAVQAVAEYFNLPFLRVKAPEVDPDVFASLPVEYLQAKRVLPIRRDPEGLTVVGICDPADIFLIDDVKGRLGARLRMVLLLPRDILQVIEELSVSPTQQVEDIIKDIAEDAVEVVDAKTEDVADLEKVAGESPVIRYVNIQIATAVKESATFTSSRPRAASACACGSTGSCSSRSSAPRSRCTRPSSRG